MLFTHKYASLLLVFATLTACDSFDRSPYLKITFEKKAAMPSGGLSSAVSFVIKDKAYIALGRNNGLQNKCYQYNPETDSWSEVSPFPGTARVNASAATIGNVAFVGLGYNSNVGVYNENGILRDFWKYNPALDQWTRLADFPASSTNKCICFTFDDKIFVGFGFSGYKFEHDMWTYDPKADQWAELPKNRVPARSGAAACINSEFLFMGTGYDTHTLKDWWRYNPRNNKWVEMRSIPGTGRITAVAFSVNERIFVSTGRLFKGDLTGGHLKDDVLEYDIRQNTWYCRGEVPGGGRENAISFVVDGKVYIGLGENEDGVLNDLWLMNDFNSYSSN